MRKQFSLTHLEVALLLYHVHCGALLPDDVGFEDADRSLSTLHKQLERRRVKVSKSALESALWSANLMSESGLFFHPFNKPFKEFVGDILNRGAGKEAGRYSFNDFYNWIEEESLNHEHNRS